MTFITGRIWYIWGQRLSKSRCSKYTLHLFIGQFSTFASFQQETIFTAKNKENSNHLFHANTHFQLNVFLILNYSITRGFEQLIYHWILNKEKNHIFCDSPTWLMSWRCEDVMTVLSTFKEATTVPLAAVTCHMDVCLDLILSTFMCTFLCFCRVLVYNNLHFFGGCIHSFSLVLFQVCACLPGTAQCQCITTTIGFFAVNVGCKRQAGKQHGRLSVNVAATEGGDTAKKPELHSWSVCAPGKIPVTLYVWWNTSSASKLKSQVTGVEVQGKSFWFDQVQSKVGE